MQQKSPKVVAIAGPNGAGKTTLAPLLLRDAFGLMEYVNADPIAQGLSRNVCVWAVTWWKKTRDSPSLRPWLEEFL